MKATPDEKTRCEPWPEPKNGGGADGPKGPGTLDDVHLCGGQGSVPGSLYSHHNQFDGTRRGLILDSYSIGFRLERLHGCGNPTSDQASRAICQTRGLQMGAARDVGAAIRSIDCSFGPHNGIGA